MGTLSAAAIRRAKRRDRAARWVITLGGLVIIASVVAILVVIVSIMLPLFQGARAQISVDEPLPAELADKEVVGVGVDLVEMGERGSDDALTAYCFSRDGTCTLLDLSEIHQASLGRRRSAASETAGGSSASVVGRVKLVPPGDQHGQTIEAVERAGAATCTLLWSDGSASLVEVVLSPEYDSAGRRSVKYAVQPRASAAAEKDLHVTRAMMRVAEGGTVSAVRLLADNRLLCSRETTTENLLGEKQTTSHRLMIDEHIPGPITAMTMDRAGKMLYAGTANGVLARWEFDDEGNIALHEDTPAFREPRAITALAMVFGDASLAVGDDHGGLSVWSEIRGPVARNLRQTHQLASHAGAIGDILPSRRDKSLVSLGGDGAADLDYVTSGRRLLSFECEQPLRQLGYSPRGNALIGLDNGGRLRVWAIDCPHPEVSWGTLFGKVHYEGYDEASFKWQSSGDEPKYSLVSVIHGSLKSTVYAMLFALPLALFAAVYVSQFTTPAFKQTIKPIIEVMAAIPSVVVGFLILLWLAPIMGRWLVAVLASMVTIPAALVIFMIVWQLVRRFDWAKRVENGGEFLALVPVMALGAIAAAAVAPHLESALFEGNFQQWLFERTQSPYDPLNSLVVAFGLGFAVIPIIFSLSEDALSNVPHSMAAASLALGASRWQTLWRVILPSASPGIFAAAMIGFGRAVGETMIVFMATGNTPIMSWSPFNGFRTLSANIAVEMPEAPVGGTLYRVLFLCAVLLFLMTFMLNTAAELVRQRLRKRFGRY